jgi:hypothetical protein
LRGRNGKFREIFEGRVNFKRGKRISAKKLSQDPSEYLASHPPGRRLRRENRTNNGSTMEYLRL